MNYGEHSVHKRKIYKTKLFCKAGKSQHMMKQNSADYYFCKLPEELYSLHWKNFIDAHSYELGFYMLILKKGF